MITATKPGKPTYFQFPAQGRMTINQSIWFSANPVLCKRPFKSFALSTLINLYVATYFK